MDDGTREGRSEFKALGHIDDFFQMRVSLQVCRNRVESGSFSGLERKSVGSMLVILV